MGLMVQLLQETWYWDSGNVTEMVMSGVKCCGDKMTLIECQDYSVVSCKRAGAAFAAGVICTDTASDLVLNAPLVERIVYVESLLYCAGEENCLSKSAANANWLYGQSRLLHFSSQIHNVGQVDFRPCSRRNSWVWHECHSVTFGNTVCSEDSNNLSRFPLEAVCSKRECASCAGKFSHSNSLVELLWIDTDL